MKNANEKCVQVKVRPYRDEEDHTLTFGGDDRQA